MRTIINRSAGRPNWSQLRNLDEPLSSCNVTACINAAQACGYDVMGCRHDQFARPSDDLHRFLHEEPLVQARWLKVCPDKSAPPNQIMEVLAFGLGLWLHAPERVVWRPSQPLSMIAMHVLHSGCVVVHGRYQGQNGPIDHINAIVGLVGDNAATGFIIDDSYGDYRTRYTSKFGDDIEMPFSDARALLKPVSDPFAKNGIFILNAGGAS